MGEFRVIKLVMYIEYFRESYFGIYVGYSGSWGLEFRRVVWACVREDMSEKGWGGGRNIVGVVCRVLNFWVFLGFFILGVSFW